MLSFVCNRVCFEIAFIFVLYLRCNITEEASAEFSITSYLVNRLYESGLALILGVFVTLKKALTVFLQRCLVI